MNVTNCASYPCVMGIINVTPDSFHSASRMQEEGALRARVRQIFDEGGRMLDVGACSTRPGAPSVSEDEELKRLRWSMPIVVGEMETWLNEHPDQERPAVSVDTFRAHVAEVCIDELGADIINDISGGTIEPGILDVVAQRGTPYILMHMRGTPENMQQCTEYPDGVTQEVGRFFNQQLAALKSACERVGTKSMPTVILDPGYGFAKTLDQNYELMRGLRRLKEQYPMYLILVGISRKSMIQRLLDVDASQALNGTTVLNTFALMQGAEILRVHDVKEAVEAVRICGRLA